MMFKNRSNILLLLKRCHQYLSLCLICVDCTHFLYTILSAGGLCHLHSYDVLDASDHL